MAKHQKKGCTMTGKDPIPGPAAQAPTPPQIELKIQEASKSDS
jgi:hypothetical protein